MKNRSIRLSLLLSLLVVRTLKMHLVHWRQTLVIVIIVDRCMGMPTTALRLMVKLASDVMQNVH